MPKKRSYKRLKVYSELHGRIQLCFADPKNPNKDIATVFGKQPEDTEQAKLLCESWNAIMSVAERLGEDPLRVAKRLQRGELVEA